MSDSSNESQEWITTKEAAQILKVSVRNVVNKIHQGRLKAKRDGKIWLVHSSLQPGDYGIGTESQQTISEAVDILKAELEVRNKELEVKNQQIEALQERLAAADGASERHDTIVLQLTRQVEQSQRLLEYRTDPWYRRLFGKGRKPPEGRQSD